MIPLIKTVSFQNSLRYKIGIQFFGNKAEKKIRDGTFFVYKVGKDVWSKDIVKWSFKLHYAVKGVGFGFFRPFIELIYDKLISVMTKVDPRNLVVILFKTI